MFCGEHMDLSMDIMEETRFKKKHSALLQKLTKELHFTFPELESLFLIYYKIQQNGKEKQGMTKKQLREILHSALDMTDDTLTGLVFMALMKGPSSLISMEMWVTIMSLLLRGSLEEKIKYCFRVYNFMGDGKIKQDIMLHFLSGSLIVQSSDDDPDDAVKDLIEILAKKMDLDRDGKVSFEDYRKACLNQPLLLEVLGQCLPSRLATYTFLTSFTPKPGKL